MNLLEFANPSAAFWMLLAIPIALLYVLKIRMRRQPVTTLLFWDRVFDEKKPRSWWQKLRHLLSLLLQLAFVSLLVSSLVDPLWSWQKKRQRRVALVVDNSASMQAKDKIGSTRLAAAKRAGNALVRSLRRNDQMAILTAGGRPRVAMGMTGHHRSLLESLDQVPATEGPTDVHAAVEMARRLLSDHEGTSEIIVLSDGCFEDVDRLVDADDVALYGFGAPTDNVAITRYQVRRSLLDAVGYQVLVDVTNFSDHPVDCRLDLDFEDEPSQNPIRSQNPVETQHLVDVIPLSIEPEQTITRVLDHTSAAGGTLVASLDVNDGLESDNRATAVVPTRTKIPVVLVSEGNLFLKSVLESIQLVSLEVVSQAPSAAPPDGILVLDRIVPPELPAGRVLVIDPQSNCDAWTLGETISQPIVAKVNPDSPITKHVRLDNVVFPDARELQFQTDWAPLIQDPLDQPLLAQQRRSSGDAVVLTCSLEKGDLPLRIAFPVLMKNAIEWFQGNEGELRPAVSTGQLVALNLKSVNRPEELDIVAADDVAVVESTDNVRKTAALELVSPSAVVTPIAMAGDHVMVGPLLETGLWTLRASGANADASSASDSPPKTADENTSPASEDFKLQIASNLASDTESNLRPAVKLPGVAAASLLTFGGRSVWFYLTCLALFLVTAEWWLYQRRIVG